MDSHITIVTPTYLQLKVHNFCITNAILFKLLQLICEMYMLSQVIITDGSQHMISRGRADAQEHKPDEHIIK